MSVLNHRTGIPSEGCYVPEIDKKLSVPNRSLRSYPGRLLFGPAGDRLFADYLEKCPGFSGRIDFIHKCNITSLFEIQADPAADFKAAECVWHPSSMTVEYEDGELAFSEVKFITKDDTACSLQTWQNRSDRDLRLTLRAEPKYCETGLTENGRLWWETPMLSHGFRVSAVIGWNVGSEHSLLLGPGQSVRFAVCACVGNAQTESREELEEKLKTALPERDGEEEYRSAKLREYQDFFDGLPVFSCSDEVLNRTWNYRWYLLKNCIARPQYGNLKRAVMYEGRGHKTGKEPLKPKGWEFCRLICLSTPLQLADLKWCGDFELIKQIILSFFDGQDADGIVNSAFVDSCGSPFCNFIGWAVYLVWLVSGDLEFVREVLPKLEAFVCGNRKLYSSGEDELQIEVRHQRTGKEYQPSYWYFSGFPLNPKEEGAYTPLKRVDRTVYHYLNIRGLAGLLEAAGDETHLEYEVLADRLAEQLNQKMWDPETEFYYDLHYQTDEKALVKNIVGIYPYWAGITGDAQKNGIRMLFDPKQFAAGSAFSTVSRDCPAWSPAGGWRGILRSRNGCVWDGPSWPYTNGIALEAAAKESRRQGHAFDREFGQFLREYSLQHFEGHDLNRPYLVEQYHAVTGEPLSDEADYNHSFYLDLIISQVCGVQLKKDGIYLDPIEIGLSWYRLYKLNIRGRELCIEFSRDRDRKELGLERGFLVRYGGKEVCRAEKPRRVNILFSDQGDGE